MIKYILTRQGIRDHIYDAVRLTQTERAGEMNTYGGGPGGGP